MSTKSRSAVPLPFKLPWINTGIFSYLNSTGRRSYVRENGYSCDSGDTVDGNILRYPLDAEGYIGKPENITPGSFSKVSGVGR